MEKFNNLIDIDDSLWIITDLIVVFDTSWIKAVKQVCLCIVASVAASTVYVTSSVTRVGLVPVMMMRLSHGHQNVFAVRRPASLHKSHLRLCSSRRKFTRFGAPAWSATWPTSYQHLPVWYVTVVSASFLHCHCYLYTVTHPKMWSYVVELPDVAGSIDPSGSLGLELILGLVLG